MERHLAQGYTTGKWDSSHCLSTQGPCSNHDLMPQVFTQNPGESAMFPWHVTGICILKKFPRQFWYTPRMMVVDSWCKTPLRKVCYIQQAKASSIKDISKKNVPHAFQHDTQNCKICQRGNSPFGRGKNRPREIRATRTINSPDWSPNRAYLVLEPSLPPAGQAWLPLTYCLQGWFPPFVLAPQEHSRTPWALPSLPSLSTSSVLIKPFISYIVQTWPKTIQKLKWQPTPKNCIGQQLHSTGPPTLEGGKFLSWCPSGFRSPPPSIRPLSEYVSVST